MVREIVRKYPRLVTSIIGLFLTVFMIGIIEGVCFILVNQYVKPPFTEEWYEITSYSKDSDRLNRLEKALGSRIPERPGIKGINIRRFQDGEVQTAIRTHDLEGRRMVQGQQTPSKKDKFILFFGCSFTYGVGVSDDETMPYYVSRMLPNYQIYNYGYGGNGPHHALALLEMPKISDDIKEPEGIAVYTFLHDHIYRAIGSMYTYNGWGTTDPYYYLDKNGYVVRKGSFQDGRPFTSFLYGLLGKSYTLKYFGFDLPIKLTKQDALLTCEIIKKARSHLKNVSKAKIFGLSCTLGILARLPL